MKSRRFGDYDLIRRVGPDGPYQVFRARHRRLERLVIVKILADRRPALDAAEALRRELDASDRLDHPAILRVYESGDVSGRPFLAHAYVEGERLVDRLARGTVPTKLAWSWIRQLAEALQHAHERQIYHGSLRPEIVWLTEAGDVRLGGFGSPVLFENLDLDASLSWAGFLAPEQAGGRGTVGRLTDIYGLGALLYAMVTGGPPFQGTTLAETCRLIRSHPAIHPSRLHPGLSNDVDEICLRCLQKDPHRRYGTDRPMLRLLDDLRRLRPDNVKSTSNWERWIRNRMSWWRAAALVLIFAALPLGFDRARHHETWHILTDPDASADRYENAMRYFSRRAVDQPRSLELHAALQLARVRLRRIEPPPAMTWIAPESRWHAVVNLSYVLAMAQAGNHEAAHRTLQQAQISGYRPTTDIERRLWEECVTRSTTRQKSD
jgi:serine/threonine-protein kinase